MFYLILWIDMKKRILFSYIFVVQLLLANISFAGYSQPVRTFFDQELLLEQEVLSNDDVVSIKEDIIPYTQQSTVVSSHSKDIIHTDTIELFEELKDIESIQEVTSDELIAEDNDFFNALESSLWSL